MPKPEGAISFSELSTLAHCEQKWWYRYEEELEGGDQSNALYLGKLVGILTAQLRAGLSWQLSSAWDDEWPEEVIYTAQWLMERYEAHYGDPLTEGALVASRVVATELELTATLPSGLQVYGFVDQLIEDHEHKLWLVERKTMKDWGRLDYISADPQLTIYAWLVRENGWNVTGIAYDAIKTYRWKRDEHPAADSFQWLWLDRSEDQIQAALSEIGAAAHRRQNLAKGAWPLHNVGPLCRTCFYRERCWEEMAFPPFQVIVED